MLSVGGGNRAVATLGQMGKDLLFENSFKRFANNRCQTNGPERFWSAVRGVFATGITMAWRQSSGIWKVWRKRLNMRESVGAM